MYSLFKRGCTCIRIYMYMYTYIHVHVYTVYLPRENAPVKRLEWGSPRLAPMQYTTGTVCTMCMKSSPYVQHARKVAHI